MGENDSGEISVDLGANFRPQPKVAPRQFSGDQRELLQADGQFRASVGPQLHTTLCGGYTLNRFTNHK